MMSRITLSLTVLAFAFGVWRVAAQDSMETTIDPDPLLKQTTDLSQELGLDAQQRRKWDSLNEQKHSRIRHLVAQYEEALQQDWVSEFEQILTPEQRKTWREHKDRERKTRATNDPDLRPNPRLQPLEAAVRTLVEKHYPAAIISWEGSTISFEWNTRHFLVHTRSFYSRKWQSPFLYIGPQGGDERMSGMRSGICGKITLNAGEYGGMAAPQTFKRYYFEDQFMVPYSEKLSEHLTVSLRYPDDAPQAFLDEFRDLIQHFDEYVQKQ